MDAAKGLVPGDSTGVMETSVGICTGLFYMATVSLAYQSSVLVREQLQHDVPGFKIEGGRSVQGDTQASL